MKCIIDLCNDNAGFISVVLTVITIILSIIAIIISIKTALLPYKKSIKIYTMLDNDNDNYHLVVSLVNEGYSSMYLNGITITQEMMNPLALGFLKEEVPLDKRILLPNVPNEYIIPLVNYNKKLYDHKHSSMKLKVIVSGKTFTKEVCWTLG